MTTVDLENIGLTVPHRWEAIRWLEENYGHMSDGNWKISNLRYIKFKDDKHATVFILRWS